MVAAVGNPGKDSGMLSMAERVRLIQRATAHIPNVTATRYTGLVVGLARSVGASTLIRVLGKESTDEVTMAAMNRTACDNIETVFVPRTDAYLHVSSRIVRAACREHDHEKLATLVPTCVFEHLSARDSA